MSRPVRAIVAACFVMALFVGAVALAGWLAAHAPFIVLGVGVGALISMLMTKGGDTP